MKVVMWFQMVVIRISGSPILRERQMLLWGWGQHLSLPIMSTAFLPPRISTA